MDLNNTKSVKFGKNIEVTGEIRMERITSKLVFNYTTKSLKIVIDEMSIKNSNIRYEKYCGNHNRLIYISPKDKNKCIIGCFEGTREEAIERIYLVYPNSATMDEYIRKVNSLFGYKNKEKIKIPYTVKNSYYVSQFIHNNKNYTFWNWDNGDLEGFKDRVTKNLKETNPNIELEFYEI